MAESAAEKIKRRQRERAILEAQEAQAAARPIPQRPTSAGQIYPTTRASFGGGIVRGGNPQAYGRSAPAAGAKFPQVAATAVVRSAVPQQRPPSTPTTPDPGGIGNVGHPGFAESLIPVWGSGREAVADFQDHDYVGAAGNGLLAASDLFLVDSVANAVRKGGLYAVTGVIGRKEANPAWKAVRREFGNKGMLAPGQHGHHWLIPQKGWGKAVPEQLKNHPLNIKPMPSAEVHGRITGSYKGKPQFNALERYWHGTPTWSKVATVDAAGHPIAAARARSRTRRQDRE